MRFSCCAYYVQSRRQESEGGNKFVQWIYWKGVFKILPLVHQDGAWITLVSFGARMYHSGCVENRLSAMVRGIAPDILREIASLWKEASGYPITDKKKVSSAVAVRLGKEFANSLMQEATTIGRVVIACAKEAKGKCGALSAIVAGKILASCTVP